MGHFCLMVDKKNASNVRSLIYFSTTFPAVIITSCTRVEVKHSGKLIYSLATESISFLRLASINKYIEKGHLKF